MYLAFKTDDRTIPGMHGSVIQNLINAENGINLDLHPGSYETQFIQAQVYIHEALDRFYKMNLPNQTKGTIEIMRVFVDGASTSNELIYVIDNVLKEMQSVKEY